MSSEDEAFLAREILTFLPNEYIIDCIRPRRSGEEIIHCIKLVKFIGETDEEAIRAQVDAGRNELLSKMPAWFNMDYSKVIPDAGGVLHTIMLWRNG